MITSIPQQTQPFADGGSPGIFARPWYRFFGLLERSKSVAYRPVDSGFAVLVAGAVTVDSTYADSSNGIQLTRNITGGTVGHLSVGTITDGESFVIDSSSATDTSTIFWTIFTPIV